MKNKSPSPNCTLNVYQCKLKVDGTLCTISLPLVQYVNRNNVFCEAPCCLQMRWHLQEMQSPDNWKRSNEVLISFIIRRPAKRDKIMHLVCLSFILCKQNKPWRSLCKDCGKPLTFRSMSWHSRSILFSMFSH